MQTSAEQSERHTHQGPAMTSYTITEPHPTVPKNSITHAGRGGAGNMFRAPATTPSTGVPTTTTSPRRGSSGSSSPGSSSSGRFYSGRGGAGNAHAAAERPVLSFGEEYALAEARERASATAYVGRGGAGNAVSGGWKGAFGPSAGRKNSDARSESSSSSSDADSDRSSIRSGFWCRLTSSSRR